EAFVSELDRVRSDREEVVGCAGGNAAQPRVTDDLGGRARQGRMIVSNPSPWQRCIHGGESMLREEVFEQILAVSGERSAFRYAACGLADSIVAAEGGAH